jgi:hypothetical protein
MANGDKSLEKFAPDRFENGRRDRRYRLDPGIRYYVLVLRSMGVETCQSCQGGPGHAYLEPTVEFYGDQAAGPRAVAAALTHGLPVSALRREWDVTSGEMRGPIWTMTFATRSDVWLKREQERNGLLLQAKEGRQRRRLEFCAVLAKSLTAVSLLFVLRLDSLARRTLVVVVVNLANLFRVFPAIRVIRGHLHGP